MAKAAYLRNKVQARFKRRYLRHMMKTVEYLMRVRSKAHAVRTLFVKRHLKKWRRAYLQMKAIKLMMDVHLGGKYARAWLTWKYSCHEPSLQQ